MQRLMNPNFQAKKKRNDFKRIYTFNSIQSNLKEREGKNVFTVVWAIG